MTNVRLTLLAAIPLALGAGACKKSPDALVLLDVRGSGSFAAPVVSVRFSVPGQTDAGWPTHVVSSDLGSEGLQFGYYLPGGSGTITVQADVPGTIAPLLIALLNFKMPVPAGVHYRRRHHDGARADQVENGKSAFVADDGEECALRRAHLCVGAAPLTDCRGSMPPVRERPEGKVSHVSTIAVRKSKECPAYPGHPSAGGINDEFEKFRRRHSSRADYLGRSGAGPGSGHRKAQREGRGSMGVRNTLNLGREVGRREQSQCRGR
jgi:hypothetical protein